jgi:predicted nucleic acid-binding protein
MAASQVPRVVLDTNVCLDLFVFGDPRCAVLRADLEEGRLEAVTNQACRGEWLAVLAYPALALGEAVRERAIAAFDAQVREVADLASTVHLPRCADPDDQKFLLLAATAGARWLLSRDRALLVLARRLQREGRFMILQPQAWAGAAVMENGRLDVRCNQSAG